MKKIAEYLKIALKAVGKFLKYTYASEVTVVALSVILYAFISRFFGILICAWGLLLWFSAYKQNSEL
jgi:hypothetical protein